MALLLPALGFIDQGFLACALVADHWQYFALPALCALAGAALASVGQAAMLPQISPFGNRKSYCLGVRGAVRGTGERHRERGRKR